jgi:hypothetical protein
VRQLLVIAFTATVLLASFAWARGPAVKRSSPPQTMQANDVCIEVEFQGHSVHVKCCRNISNVVLQYGDGARQKFEDLNGNDLQLSGIGRHKDKPIVTAWVKSGANFSGEGPGYGQRFDRPKSLRPTHSFAPRSSAYEAEYDDQSTHETSQNSSQLPPIALHARNQGQRMSAAARGK